MSLPSRTTPANLIKFPRRWTQVPSMPGLSVDLTASPFVGHDRLLSSLVDRIQSGADRLITLTGPGGIGKTRLAQEVTHHLAPGFGGRVAWIPLAPIQNPDLVVVAFAEAFGLESAFGPNPLLARALDWLGDAPALLVLDNAEHLPGIGPGVGCTVRNCPRVVVIVTSRIALGLEEECAVVVPPLDVPPVAPGPQDNDRIFEAPALRLFEERARLAAPGFRLSRENAHDVAAVCAHLGGMPLAIELAASRTALYSPVDLLALNREIVPVIDGDNDAAGGANLRATVHWAFGRLSPAAHAAATWLAQCPGGFSLETARSLCGVGPGIISELLDHHLVQATDDTTGRRRFEMHELIRQAALEFLECSGQQAVAEATFRAVMRDVATGFTAKPRDRHYNDNLAALAIVVPNLRQALEQSIEHGDLESAADLLLALEHYWRRRGRFDEMSYWIDKIHALNGADDAGRHPRAHAVFSLVTGQLLLLQGQLAQAIPLVDDAVAFARASGDLMVLGSCIMMRSWLAIQGRDFESAARYLAEGVKLANARNAAGFSLDVERQLGASALFQERLPEAETHLLRALELGRSLGEPGELAGVLHYLGYTMAFSGEFARGRAYLEEAISLLDPSAPRATSWVLQPRGRLEIRAGNPAAAAPLVAEVLRLRFDNGDTSLVQTALIDAACVFHLADEPVLAAQVLGAARAEQEHARPRTMFNGPGQVAYDALQAAMGTRVFQRHYRDGAAMPLAEFIPAILDRLASICVQDERVPPATAFHLSPRELEVLALIVQGYSNREIATALYVGIETVKTHTRHVLRKLDVSTRSAAVAVAVREGLVPPATPGISRPGPRSGRSSAPGGARAG